MVKVKIKKQFRDKDTFKMYEVDSTVDFTEERIKTIKEKLGSDFIEEEKATKSPVKKTTRKKTPSKKD